jgi:DNA invertase Pin-like site-specific DNA recombinase
MKETVPGNHVVSRFAISSKAIGAMGREPIPAAQYVRMSTEHQRYSTENQSDAILQYAVRYGFDIVRTYADNGKSGLRLDGRNALKQLLIDVEGGSRGFRAVLVYDVSRWGRFQDADESAYYEYVCRRSGVEIRYCAEQFENDGSVASTIVKTVKRAMAGEYSRELSAKVFAGQCRLIELGFRQGGHAGYGLRRRLIDQNGDLKATLGFGEQKSLQTDRVVLEPGPVEEVETVRRMFGMFVYERKHQREIAAVLNHERITTDLGRRWTARSVQQVLTNEKYIGNNVFNRASAKLKNKRTANPPGMWIRAVGAFPSIVDPELFRAAQTVLATRYRHLSDDEMLALLKDLYVKHGRLSSIIIDQSKDLPVSLTYRQRFGSLGRVYQLVGYVQQRTDRLIEINRTLRRLHSEVYRDVITKIEQLGGSVARDGPKGLITINGEFTGSIVIARCLSTRGGGAMRWSLRLDTALRPDITVAVRLAPDNEQPMDYYLLPQIDIKASRLRIAQRNAIFLDAYRCDTLHRFFQISARMRLGSVE